MIGPTPSNRIDCGKMGGYIPLAHVHGFSFSIMSQARRTLRRPGIYAYVERLGINSSLIRPHYELPIAMVASSGKKKSRQGITIRKNKQPVSTIDSSSSHLNRTESSHSNYVRSASNMIPCFPANNSTDAHHCDTVSNRSSPSHFTKDLSHFKKQNI